jgi:lipoic acid synthetase
MKDGAAQADRCESRRRQGKGRTEDGPHPDQDRPAGATAQAGLDSRQGRQRCRVAFGEIKKMLREQKLHTVCEEAACPEHRRMLRPRHGDLHDPRRHLHAPLPVLRRRPRQAAAARCRRAGNLADSVARLKLRYVVITSVDRDDLRDGGAQHFVEVISRRASSSSPARPSKPWSPIFVAAWRSPSRCSDRRLPDVLNHNLETVPRLYRQAAPVPTTRIRWPS